MISGRIALGVEYDGTGFRGWQTQQAGVRTVQTCLEAALGRVADHPVSVQCAGRTDAGVHALEQVVHFETSARRRERSWVLGANVNLPPDVAVRWAHPVDESLSCALQRHRPALPLPNHRWAHPFSLRRDRAVWAHASMDPARMQAAAVALVGEHDFSSFRAVACQAKSPVRHLHYLEVLEQDEMLTLRVGANGFLHHMVRNIAGVLMAIGRGDAAVEWTQELLEARDRTLGGVTAPPHGLYFVRADYPDDFGLPQLEVAGASPRLAAGR